MVLKIERPSLYVENRNHVFRPERLDDAEYARALSAMVVYCVDVLPIVDRDQGLVALPYRIALPYVGYWYIGGRVLPGEREEVAIARKFRQETGVTIEPDRFEYVRPARYWWTTRAQEPQNVGCDMVGVTFMVEISNDELGQMLRGLDPREYKHGETRVFARAGLLEHDVHQSLIDTYDTIFPGAFDGDEDNDHDN